MYDTRTTGQARARKDATLVTLAATLIGLATVATAPRADAQIVSQTEATESTSAQTAAFDAAKYNPSIIRRITGPSEKLELTTNSGKILTLEKRIPRVQVNNPELLTVTPLSDKQIQVAAKRVGITQINLWDEDDNIYSIDVIIYGDAQELEHALKVQFPHSSIRVYRYTDSLVLKGFVDQPMQVSQIVRLAEDYAPKVINNISVGGVQQILLKVKVMEVSRTKLRQLGVDWAYLGGGGGFALNSVSEILSLDAPDVLTNNNDTFAWGIVNGGDSFSMFLEALQEHRVGKILAEPNLVAISGRPAQFNVGGEFPVLIPQSLGTTSIEYKPYGTQIDFLPIVLGNGNIRLEVRPRISEIDDARTVVLSGNEIPALSVRQVDTAVEMKAGQTFALAGLIQERVRAVNRGLPYLSDIPVFGVPFRKVEENVEEIELLVLVTPEFVDAIDPSEVPCGGPGMDSVSPTNEGLYCGGHVEVPPYCNPIRGPHACDNYCGGGCGTIEDGYTITTDGDVYNGELILPGGSGLDDGSHDSPAVEPLPAGNGATHGELSLPPTGLPERQSPSSISTQGPTAQNLPPLGPELPASPTSPTTTGGMPVTSPRAYSPGRPPTFLRNAANPQNRSAATQGDSGASGIPALIGPVGYDVQ